MGFSTTIINRINNNNGVLKWTLNILLQLRNVNATDRNMKMLIQTIFLK